MKPRISCSERCCCWSVCFVQTELVSTIRSYNSLRHVRRWKKIVEMQEVFLVSGQTLSFIPFSSVLFLWCSPVWLQRALHCHCLSSSFHWVGAVVQGDWWPTVGSPLALLLQTSSQLRAAPVLGGRGGGVSGQGVGGDFIFLCLTWQLCWVYSGVWNSNGQLSMLMISGALWLHTGLSRPLFRDLQERNGPLVGAQCMSESPGVILKL